MSERPLRADFQRRPALPAHRPQPARQSSVLRWAAATACGFPRAPGPGQAPSRQNALAEFCRRLVLEAYAPAAVLINSKHECLFSLGPTDRYLRVAPGSPTYDLLAMARPGMRATLRSAIQRAAQENTRIVVAGGRTDDNDDADGRRSASTCGPS